MFRQDNSNNNNKSDGMFILQWPLQNNNRQKYIRKRLLGKGGFAKCYEIEDQTTGDRFACKIIDKETIQYKKTKQKVQSEISIHKKLSHRNIVHFERYYQNQHYIYILLELCNTTLDKILERRKNLHEIQARYYLYQIIQAVVYLHQQHVIHRDLKLENFLLSEDMQVKIGDFGLAAYYNAQHKRRSVCGTLNYMAPEILTEKEGYSIQIDIWSLGIAAFILLTGKFPFENNDVKKISRQITNKTYFFKTNISQTSKDLVSSMLQLNPKDRITVKQLLKHPFFTNYQIPKQLPLSCFVCYPAQSFIQQYKYTIQSKLPPKKTQDQDEQQFRFMLQSNKQSPLTPKPDRQINIQSLPYYQHISSQKNDKQIDVKYDDTKKRVCSFEYDSKRNNSCNIKKWITQTQEYPKHGIMYRVNDGARCFRFNDGTNLKLCDRIKTKFIYISQKQQQTPINLLQQQTTTKHILTKQITLKLKIFLTYLQKIVLDDDCQHTTTSQTIFIRLYYNCHDIFIIWLNNGMIQGKFDDESELILDIDSCMYIDENKIKSLFSSMMIHQQDSKVLRKKEILFETVRRHAKLKWGGQRKDKENRRYGGNIDVVEGGQGKIG